MGGAGAILVCWRLCQATPTASPQCPMLAERTWAHGLRRTKRRKRETRGACRAQSRSAAAAYHQIVRVANYCVEGCTNDRRTFTKNAALMLGGLNMRLSAGRSGPRQFADRDWLLACWAEVVLGKHGCLRRSFWRPPRWRVRAISMFVPRRRSRVRLAPLPAPANVVASRSWQRLYDPQSGPLRARVRRVAAA